jgi:hypothetical protein
MNDTCSLVELTSLRVAAKAELARLDALIASHPETIAELFAEFLAHPGCAALASNVTCVEPASGHTDSRKNVMDWHGYRFRVDGDLQLYWMRHGENWCSELNDCGKDGDVDCPDLDMDTLQNWESGDETVGGVKVAALDWICTLPTWQAIGHLLRCVQGW